MKKSLNLVACSLVLFVSPAAFAAGFTGVANARMVIQNALNSSNLRQLRSALDRYNETEDMLTSEVKSDVSIARVVLTPEIRSLGKKLNDAIADLSSAGGPEAREVVTSLQEEVLRLRKELEERPVGEEPIKGPVTFEAVLKVAEDQVAKTVAGIRKAGAGLSKEQKEEINTAADVTIFRPQDVRMMRRR